MPSLRSIARNWLGRAASDAPVGGESLHGAVARALLEAMRAETQFGRTAWLDRARWLHRLSQECSSGEPAPRSEQWAIIAPISAAGKRFGRCARSQRITARHTIC
jgi:hypothetical protein